MPPGSQEWTDKRFWYKSEWWKEISTENGSIKIRKKSIKNSELYFSFAHIMYGSTVTQLISFLVRINITTYDKFNFIGATKIYLMKYKT